MQKAARFRRVPDGNAAKKETQGRIWCRNPAFTLRVSDKERGGWTEIRPVLPPSACVCRTSPRRLSAINSENNME